MNPTLSRNSRLVWLLEVFLDLMLPRGFIIITVITVAVAVYVGTSPTPPLSPEQVVHNESITRQLMSAEPGSIIVFKGGATAPIVHQCSGCLAQYRDVMGRYRPIRPNFGISLERIEQVVTKQDPKYSELASKLLAQ